MGVKEPLLTTLLILPCLSLFPQACVGRGKARKVSGWGSRLFSGLPAPLLAWKTPSHSVLMLLAYCRRRNKGGGKRKKEKQRPTVCHL